MDTSLSVRLAGIPVDGTRIQLLLDSLGVDERCFYRPLDANHPVEAWHWPHGDLPLVASGRVEETETDEGAWVTGIVTTKSIAHETGAADPRSGLPEVLRFVDRLICSRGSGISQSLLSDRIPWCASSGYGWKRLKSSQPTRTGKRWVINRSGVQRLTSVGKRCVTDAVEAGGFTG